MATSTIATANVFLIYISFLRTSLSHSPRETGNILKMTISVNIENGWEAVGVTWITDLDHSGY